MGHVTKASRHDEIVAIGEDLAVACLEAIAAIALADALAEIKRRLEMHRAAMAASLMPLFHLVLHVLCGAKWREEQGGSKVWQVAIASGTNKKGAIRRSRPLQDCCQRA